MTDYKSTTFEGITTDDPATQRTSVLIDGTKAAVRVGGFGCDGDVGLVPPNISGTGQDPITTAQATIHLRASTAGVRIGGGAGSAGLVENVGVPGKDGKLSIQNGAGGDVFVLDASSGTLRLGGGAKASNTSLKVDGRNGAIKVLDASAIERMSVDAVSGQLVVRDAKGKPSIVLDGQTGGIELDTGDLKLDKGGVTLDKGDLVVKGGGNIHVQGKGDITVSGNDCAEDFDFAESETIEPGTVVVIDDGERLSISTRAYDRRVAGVRSGAGAFQPGLVLGRTRGVRRIPVALVGRVYCKVDADHGAIAVGDLLTSSPTPGHAMKASDPARAFGAVIGKAMQPLARGRGLIPILVALQ